MTIPPDPTGKVTLLGAGPGAADLLTIRAAKVLASADVVLLDDLVDPEIAALAPQARIVRVGKRGGCRSTPQAFIEKLMCRYALRGRHVVRVKGGDALLFGRAGEELAALRAAGVPVAIVNGISSGFAAAAELGVSLTHRRHCQGVTFVTAHLQDHGEPDWAALGAAGTTLVVYMGMSRIERVAAGLLAALDATTPAAVVQWAGTPRARHWLGTLAALAHAPAAAGLGSPAVILVGPALGEALAMLPSASACQAGDDGAAAGAMPPISMPISVSMDSPAARPIAVPISAPTSTPADAPVVVPAAGRDATRTPQPDAKRWSDAA